MKQVYNPWPLGQLPEHLQRPEIKQLREKGYDIGDARDAIDLFEEKVAKYTGAKYAISVDNCTDALFLILKYTWKTTIFNTIEIPSKTYVSVPQSILQAGFDVRLDRDTLWRGMYRLRPFEIYDSAARFTKDMYIKDSSMALSFQIKKRIPIGKGGMILTDDIQAYNWYKKARYEGRDLSVAYDKDDFTMMGWNMYMCPEDAARGVLLFDEITQNGELELEDMWGSENYPDLSEKNVLKNWE